MICHPTLNICLPLQIQSPFFIWYWCFVRILWDVNIIIKQRNLIASIWARVHFFFLLQSRPSRKVQIDIVQIRLNSPSQSQKIKFLKKKKKKSHPDLEYLLNILLSDMTIKSYLAASYALHMLLTFPFGPTYFTPANKKIKIVNIDKYVTSTQKRTKK